MWLFVWVLSTPYLTQHWISLIISRTLRFRTLRARYILRSSGQCERNLCNKFFETQTFISSFLEKVIFKPTSAMQQFIQFLFRFLIFIHIFPQSWRVCYYGIGVIGLIITLFSFLTLKEPPRTTIGEEGTMIIINTWHILQNCPVDQVRCAVP